MKKLVFSMIVIMIMAISFPVSAKIRTAPPPSATIKPTSTPLLSPTKTDKRFAFEFSELFGSRFSLLNQELGNKFNESYISLPIVVDYEDTFNVQTTGAYLFLNKKDFTIEKAMFTIYKIGADDDENEKIFYESAVALSSLEFSGLDDSLMQITKKSGYSKSKNATDEAIRILKEEIAPSVNANYDLIVGKNLSYEIYTGNYVYTVSYFSTTVDDRKLEYLHLTANAK